MKEKDKSCPFGLIEKIHFNRNWLLFACLSNNRIYWAFMISWMGFLVPFRDKKYENAINLIQWNKRDESIIESEKDKWIKSS